MGSYFDEPRRDLPTVEEAMAEHQMELDQQNQLDAMAGRREVETPACSCGAPAGKRTIAVTNRDLMNGWTAVRCGAESKIGSRTCYCRHVLHISLGD